MFGSNAMKYTVDRIGEGRAVLESETGERLVIEASLLPEGAREGSCLTETDGVFLPDPVRERKRRKKLYRMLRSLKSKKQ